MESSLIRRFCREGRGVGIDAAIHVVLMEKEGEVGGILKSEQAIPFKKEMYGLAHTCELLAEIAKTATVHTGYKGMEVTREGILCTDPSGAQVLVPGDTMICALGQRSRTDVVEALRDCAPFVRVIGDAAKVSTITNAVYWGHWAAMDI